MKTFKSFLMDRIDEVAKPKAKGEKDFFDSHKVEVSDIEDQKKEGSAKVLTKERSGKRKADAAPVSEADFTKQQTKMAHTIGKEFAKKKVGDKEKGGPYAVASAMVRDRPEAAKKAYATIKAKMKEEIDQLALISLFDSLNEQNQAVFMEQLEMNTDKLLKFAHSKYEG